MKNIQFELTPLLLISTISDLNGVDPKYFDNFQFHLSFLPGQETIYNFQAFFISLFSLRKECIIEMTINGEAKYAILSFVTITSYLIRTLKTDFAVYKNSLTFQNYFEPNFEKFKPSTNFLPLSFSELGNFFFFFFFI